MRAAQNSPSNKKPRQRFLIIVAASDENSNSNVIQMRGRSSRKLVEDGAGTARKTKVTLLLIEDNPADAELFKDQLEAVDGFDFEIFVSESLGHAAAILAEKLDFDVVVADLTLPDSTGLDTFTQLKGTISGIPIIVLTGIEDRTVSLKAMELGAANYLLKQKMTATRIATAIISVCKPS